jgi:hypothetical protein
MAGTGVGVRWPWHGKKIEVSAEDWRRNGSGVRSDRVSDLIPFKGGFIKVYTTVRRVMP